MGIKGLKEFIKEKQLNGMFLVAFSINDNMCCNFTLIEAYSDGDWAYYQFKPFHKEMRDACEGQSYELVNVYKINAEEVK